MKNSNGKNNLINHNLTPSILIHPDGPTLLAAMLHMGISIDRLAAEVGMSRSGFQHSYKKMFGVSPIFDIITSRLDKAKRLLSGTSMSVEEVSLSCGYRSSYSFMRQFRNKTGKTPTEYRLETKNTK